MLALPAAPGHGTAATFGVPALALQRPHSSCFPLAPISASGAPSASASALPVCPPPSARQPAAASGREQGRTGRGVWGMTRDKGRASSIVGRGQAGEGEGEGLAAGAEQRTGTEAEVEVEVDEDMRTELNQLSTEAVRAMLAGEGEQLWRLREKVDKAGEMLVRQGLMDAACFMLVLRAMLDHQVVPEAELLVGLYKRAYEKIGSIMEDSGWLLAPPETEGGNVEMVDDELIPPTLQTPYN